MDPGYNMDVDDLFGDSEHVTLQTITATPPIKGLARRVDELGASGCCQRIAWSKNGCVAYISPDGYSINLKVFSRDTVTGKWDLGKPVPLELPQGREIFPFTHLSWSHLGNDLAVMDEAGRVMVFTCAMALDRLQLIRAELAHPESEVDSVVGMHWLAMLPYEQKNHIAWSAARHGSTWKWNIESHKFRDAHHPVDGKASLIYLKRHGELKLRFQQNDSSWHESVAQLGPMISTKEPFTHAAFASNNGMLLGRDVLARVANGDQDNSLLLAAYDVQSRLHLFRVETLWTIPHDKRAQTAGPFEKPTIHVSLITVEDDCNPIDLANGELSNGTASRGAAAAQLTHLNFLPVTPEQDNEQDIGSIPTIQAIFCRPPNVISFDQLGPHETPHSIIVRWEVQQIQKSALHASLDQVTSKKKVCSSVSATSGFLLKRLPDFTLHAVVLAFHPIWYNMLLAFCYSDGTIEFRKRSTMETIMPDGNTDTVTSLLQAGFVFPHAEPSLHTAFSPNHCMAACMQQEDAIKLRSIEYQHGTLATDDEDPRHSAALAALILQSSSAANQYYSSDDIFAIIGPLSDKRKQDFINLLFEGLAVNIDCGIDEMSNNHLILLGRSPFFVKTLSAMHLLGLEGTINRSLSSKMAWITLNIKYVTQILTTIARMHGSLEKTSLRPEVVPQFIGICRWVMHFMAYILDELFTIGRAVEDIPSSALTRDVLEAKIHELNKPAVLLLLSAFPRAMMKLWAQPIAWVKRSAETFTNPSAPTPSPEIRRLYTPLQVAVNELPFEWRWFEVLVSETNTLVRGTYKKAGLSDAKRNIIERELLLGKIPDILLPIAKRLVTDTLWNSSQQGGCLADKLDAGRLMFFDTTWLGFQESKRGVVWHDTHVVDVCQKMVIRGVGTQMHPSMLTPQQQQQQQQQQQNSRGRSDSLQTVHAGLVGEVNGGGGGGEKRKAQLRQCVRCGACMEDVVLGLPGYTSHHASWLMSVAKHCVCGNSWMLAEEKKGAR
ncbi:Mediator of RNA polymerase II transcription subunit 16 [Neocucurbitaria cava]|uniref:Mediator of RNA polymerase II transcription subunit 16 n=1 Tax=Neocucurbitaria cava TaxID=798079 RepID=A0A9W8Y468_9PLEO|nr:Mediator of RNA polymerase II transcription subunit 16 [Neocucurbitaria cava]